MATAAPALSQATYKNFGTVRIVAVQGSMTQVCTENENEFWVPTSKLKPVKQVRFIPSAPPAIDNSKNAWQNFVAYLNAVGYRLEVHTRTGGVERLAAEYAEWSGEYLPDSAIKIYDNRPTERCWRLFFKLQDGVSVPFQIDLAGTTGKHPTNKPRGLWARSGKVDVYFTELIAQLVRAGLRATDGGDLL